MNNTLLTMPGHNFNVPKSLAIPYEATHYASAMMHKFYRIKGERRWVWMGNRWEEIEKHPVLGWGVAYPVRIERIRSPESSIKVKTEYGPGVVVGKDKGRVLVDLDESPFNYRPVAFQPYEINQEEVSSLIN